MFNALKYTEELEKAGFTRQQAEVSMRLLIDIMNENFATKADLKSEMLAIRTELKDVEWRLDSKIQAVGTKIQSLDTKLDSSLKEMEYKLTIKLGTLMALSIGVTATLVKLIPTLGH
jgi:predicted  nucleic acid-binding Zn-ribbon protein